MPERLLAVEGASVFYGRGHARSQALRGVSLGFDPGKLTLIIGPSGSGKTTLLALLGCLMVPDQGAVFVQGQDVTRISEAARTRIRRRQIGFVFQAFRLFRSLRALDNVAMGSEVTGAPGSRQRAGELLRRFDLLGKAHLKPDELSGGEKQRVAIARALIKDPPILLADEPTASLDSQAGHQISQILFELAEEQGRTVVVVSHDPRWEKFAHKIVVLQDGQVARQTAGEEGRRETCATLSATAPSLQSGLSLPG
jgi:putative ABC transport system ATP-binding protein